MYKKIKKQNGEKFAQVLRDFHNGILEIPDINVILRHAGREAEPLLPYLMSMLSSNDDTPSAPASLDPIALLDQAGYKAFHADTLEKQNSIKHYFKKSELLCTFNNSARYKDYHMIHAIKKNVDSIKREDFNGKEKREDAYGTSVISIQMLKNGGFISIKNRYNHTVSACDNTFNSNPDNIIDGLSKSLKEHFNVDFSATKAPLPEHFLPIRGQIFKYHQEINNIYYGDQSWAQDGTIHEVNKSMGDALFDGFLFDNKNKILKKIDPLSKDSFADNFNRSYGGNSGLNIQNGNLTLNGEDLIIAERSLIKTLNLPLLTSMTDNCLSTISALTHFNAPSLTSMGWNCLSTANALTQFNAPSLASMGGNCLSKVNSLTHFNAPSLTSMGRNCLHFADSLTQFDVPSLISMGDDCLSTANALMKFNALSMMAMGGGCLSSTDTLTQFNAPLLINPPSHLMRSTRSCQVKPII